MTLTEYGRLVRRGWPTILVFVVLGVLAGLGVFRLTPTTFAATAQVYVSVQAPDAATAGDLGQANVAAQQKVDSYTQVASTSRVLQPVIDQLKLHTTPMALARRVKVSPLVNTVVISITATDRQAAQAARIANAVSVSFQREVGGLDTSSSNGKSLVRVEIVQPAVTPTARVTPILSLDLLFGGGAGLLVGFTATGLRGRFDTRIRSDHDLAEVTSRPIIGEIAFDTDAAEHPLVIQSQPRSAKAEAFRSLRTNLQFIDAENPARVFALTSAMPSEGKTTTTANLAIALSEGGSRVVVVDADLRRPRLGEVMGLEGAVGLTDVLIGRAELDDVSQPWGSRGLHVIPAGRTPPNPSELVGSKAMRAVLGRLSDEYDYVVLDAPPLLPVTDAAVMSKLTDGIVVLAASGRSRRPALTKALTDLEQIGTRVLGVVMTMLPQHGPNKGLQASYGGYYGTIQEPVSGRRRA